MNRQQRAIEFAKQEVIRQNPWMADKQARIAWWKEAHPIEKQMFLDTMSIIAESDLDRVEELEVIQ